MRTFLYFGPQHGQGSCVSVKAKHHYLPLSYLFASQMFLGFTLVLFKSIYWDQQISGSYHFCFWEVLLNGCRNWDGIGRLRLWSQNIDGSTEVATGGVLQKRCSKKNFAKFTGKHLRKHLNFANFLRTPFLTEHLRRLLVNTSGWLPLEAAVHFSQEFQSRIYYD